MEEFTYGVRLQDVALIARQENFFGSLIEPNNPPVFEAKGLLFLPWTFCKAGEGKGRPSPQAQRVVRRRAAHQGQQQ
eukprot:6652809-Pyramimonas_sp.AAC.1